jgi:Tol biopolymer transport system component
VRHLIVPCGPVALSVSAWCLALGCQGDLITLGKRLDPHTTADRDANTMSFSAPRVLTPTVVPVIGSDSKDDNPTLTGDLLEIYFTSTRGGDSDVWYATRESADVDFGEPIHLAVVNTSAFESSPAIESDGLTLWLGRRADDGLGGVDIYVSRRASRDAEWSEPELVTSLSSAGDDIPRPPGNGGLLMPLASRNEGDTYRLYLAARATTQSEFSAPTLLEAVQQADYGSVDGFVTWDGAHLLFTGTRDELGDLFIAPSNGTAFAEPVPLNDVNTQADERDPWLSPDGSLLFFASDRDDVLRIYQARVEWD